MKREACENSTVVLKANLANALEKLVLPGPGRLTHSSHPFCFSPIHRFRFCFDLSALPIPRFACRHQSPRHCAVHRLTWL